MCRLRRRDEFGMHGDPELSLCFRARSHSDEIVPRRIFLTPSLIAFRDVARHREGSPPELIAEPRVS